MGAELHLGVAEPGSDDGRMEELALSLRRELLALDVGSVEPYRVGESPDGTRGAGLALAGALVVSLQPTLQVVGAVVALVREWARRGNRSVRLEIGGDVLELTGASAEVQQRLVEAWIAKHTVS